MSFVSTAVLALSMSTDAFAVAVGRGTQMRDTRWREALRVGAFFGLIEGITPVLGWLAGLAAHDFISAIDHWIAFVVLSGLGVKTILESRKEARADGADKLTESTAPKSGRGMLFLTALGTSIDALVVGVTLAFWNVNIWIASAAIGLATFGMVTLGLMTGHYLGRKAGHTAETLGGVGLILIGSKILLEHLGYL